MKLLFSLLCGLTLFLTVGCGAEADDFCANRISIEQYIEDTNQAAEGTIIEHESGLRYIIFEEGSEERAQLTSIVDCEYEGKLTNENVFDGGRITTIPLGNLIEGWRIGLQQIGAGGRMRLFIPSELGYGSRRSGQICANSDLVFDVTLNTWIDN